MTLSKTIQDIPDWQSKTASELFTLLTEVRTEPDPTPYTFASMGEELTRRGLPGSDIRSQVSYTMMQVELKEIALPTAFEKARGDIRAAYIAMSATKEGLSLHTPERQALVGLLTQVGQWPAGVDQAVLSLGVRQYTLASDAGLSIVLGDVEAALGQIQLEAIKQTKRQAAATRYNAYVDALDSWDGSGPEPVF
jgi:hypothetical protein